VYVWQDVVDYPVTLDDQGPKGVALDRNCNLYPADTSTDHIVKVSPSGDTLATWGSDGKGAAQFHRPRPWQSRVTATSTSRTPAMIASRICRRRANRSPSGNVACQASNPCAPEPGHNPGQFFDPEGIAIDVQGNVYVTEVGNNRVQKLTKDGKSVAALVGHRVMRQVSSINRSLSQSTASATSTWLT
jgi:hypothetical protein